MVQQWNSSQSSTNIALSGSPTLTAALVSGSSTENNVYAAVGVTGGAFYWELALSGTGIGATAVAGGIGNILSSVVIDQFLGIGTDSLGWYSDGTVWNNNVGTLATWATWTTPALLGFALDMTNHKIWGRVSNGTWFGSASGGNPATGTLGLTVPAAIYAAAVVPGATIFNTTAPDTATAAFATAAWTFVAPAGFGPIDAAWSRAAVSAFR